MSEQPALNLRAKEILTFIPSVIDFETAKRFYQEIGFEVDHEDDSLAILRKNASRFFLQNNSGKPRNTSYRPVWSALAYRWPRVAANSERKSNSIWIFNS